MFSILSLFTEDVKLRHGSQSSPEQTDANLADPMTQDVAKDSTPVSPLVPPVPESPRTHFAESRLRHSSHMPGVRSSSNNLKDLPYIPLLNPASETSERKQANSVHPGIIARANIDTTIAVIPAEVALL